MKRIELCELKTIQLDILNEIDTFCKKNQISYWLDYGTLLGAVRHKGFIPWDDDIDIGMLRSDYDRFISLFNFRNSPNSVRYQAFNGEFVDVSMKLFFTKVFDMNTSLVEKEYASRIAVDIFPYDNVPDNKFSMVIMRLGQKIFMSIHAFQVYDHQPSGTIFRRNVIFLLRKLCKLISPQFVRKHILKTSRKYRFTKTKQVALVFDWIATADRQLFEDLRDIEFEGNMYPAPKNYDTWLTAIYGDYMTPPPEERRTGHVIKDIFWVD